ncbi:MAG: hypothetical protein WC794_00600 [Candidatus Doudnabacteria bacterium]|jgi:tRNA pseudouridine55 synthase
MRKQIYNIYKPIGLTPLQALEAFRKQAKLPAGLKMSYAGRLDPLAEGVLIIISGDKLKEKDKFLKLNKTYRAQILFGVATDTFDLMGKITSPFRANASERGIPDKRSLGCTRDGNTETGVRGKNQKEILLTGANLPTVDKIKREMKNLVGNIVLPIPPYSSVPINGKPSFMHARAGELSLKNIQSREMKILKITFEGFKTISAQAVLKSAQQKISKVSGDFRQKEILKLWKQKLSGKSFNFKIINMEISCASGTYIRSIAHQLGTQLNCPALLYHLTRQKVGRYNTKSSIKLKKTSR